MALAKEMITRRFDAAAEEYDQEALVQAQIARHMVDQAVQLWPKPPSTALDIGCGTGFVAQEIAQRWPQTSLTGVDSASAMLREAKRKLPAMHAVLGDVTLMEFQPSFDLILSN